MSLAALWNIPETQDQLSAWSFVNAAAHADIIARIFQATGKQLDSFILDPFDPHDEASFQPWLYQHQAMHQQMDAILGIQGYDLTDVDFSNDGLLAGWIQSHAVEHMQAGQILNLG
jgi:hypothetical protein